MDLLSVGLALVLLALAVECWLGYKLLLQHGRILHRVEALEAWVRSPAAVDWRPALIDGPEPALPIGSPAPDFELPSLGGEAMTRSHWRGRRQLLIFVDSLAPAALVTLPDLAKLGDGSTERLQPLIVATGDAEAIRSLVAEHRIRCPVLLQQSHEVQSLFGVTTTPTGFLVDELGAIASGPLVGAQAILAVARSPDGAATQTERHGGFGTRSLANSRIVRNGLPAGTRAPGFNLPLIGGGRLALEDLRGHPILLVFSDPGCGPCNALAPSLEQLHRRADGSRVVMVGRGSPEANQAKVEEHGLTFPVVLQGRWEISRAYGIFVTPVAFLIDAEGVIAADVAVGADAILALAERARAMVDAMGLATVAE